MNIWSILRTIVELVVVPMFLYYIQRQIKARDDKRQAEYHASKLYQAEQQKKNTDIQFLMMERIDSLSDLTQMMAKKLHDAGIINGDLDHMNQKYEGLNSDYERSIKNLALKVLNK